MVFRTNNGALTASHFSSMQVLQYGSTWRTDRVLETKLSQVFPQAYLNIVLNCVSNNNQTQKCFTIRGMPLNTMTSTQAFPLTKARPVNQDTNVSLLTGRPRYVTIEHALCFQEIMEAGLQDSLSTDSLQCSTTTLEFSDSKGMRRPYRRGGSGTDI